MECRSSSATQENDGWKKLSTIVNPQSIWMWWRVMGTSHMQTAGSEILRQPAVTCMLSMLRNLMIFFQRLFVLNAPVLCLVGLVLSRFVLSSLVLPCCRFLSCPGPVSSCRVLVLSCRPVLSCFVLSYYLGLSSVFWISLRGNKGHQRVLCWGRNEGEDWIMMNVLPGQDIHPVSRWGRKRAWWRWGQQ
jgi:hypothetical protein